MLMAFAKTKARIDQYAKDKTWYWHLPLWLFGLYVFVELLGFHLGRPMSFILMIPYSFDFMLHEMAHIMTAWLPPIITAAAGSASELLLGALLVQGAFLFSNYFASIFCCLWMMLACESVGDYMADAIPQHIPLVSLGGAMSGSEQTIHDWHFVFGQLNLLDKSALIGHSFRVLGVLFGVFGILFSAWIMYKMAAAKDQKPKMTQEDLAVLKAAAAPSGMRANPSSPDGGVYPNAIKGSLVAKNVPPTPKSGPPDLGSPPPAS